MDSSMEIDNSDFHREVQQLNNVAPSPGLGKRTRTQYEAENHMWGKQIRYKVDIEREARYYALPPLRKKPIGGNIPLGHSNITLDSNDDTFNSQAPQEDKFLHSTPAWTHKAVQSPVTAKKAYSPPPWGPSQPLQAKPWSPQARYQPQASFQPQAHNSPLTRGSPLGNKRFISPRSPRRSSLRPYTSLPTHYEMEMESPRYTSIRRIGGFCTTFVTRAYLMAVGVWNLLTCGARLPIEDSEIIAVETDGSGRKRRAVSKGELPGSFPDTPSQLLTPPESESEPESAPNDQAQEIPNVERHNGRIAPPGAVKYTMQRPSKNDPRPANLTFAKERNAARAAEIGAVWKSYKSPPKFKAIDRIRSKSLHSREAEIRKDSEVDSLIARAQKAKLDSPEARRIKRAIQLRHEQEAEKAAAEKAAAEKLIQEEAERKAAAEFAEEQQALQDALEAEYQAKEAEREALHAKKQKLVRDLDPEWEARVQDALAVHNTAHVLSNIPGGAPLTRGDLARILPSGGGGGMQAWLNDESINGWFAAIVEAKNEQTGFVKGPNNVPSIEAYNSGWITTYNAKGIKGLTTWSRRKSIQGKKLLRADKIYFPINTGGHWMLLIICPSTRTLEFLDSMGNSAGKWFKFAREWLQMELGDAYIADEWKESSVSSSYQTNGHDCGVFTCVNALASAKGVDFSEVRADNMQQARQLMAAVLLNGGFKGDFQL